MGHSGTTAAATGELRAKLDELGMEYVTSEDDTTIFYDVDGNRYTYNVNPESGWAQLYGYNITPEQAIAATVGNAREPSNAVIERIERFCTDYAQCLVDATLHDKRPFDAVDHRTCESMEAVEDKLIRELAEDIATMDKDIEHYDGSRRRGTVAILQGGRKPEEVLFVGKDGVTHYLPEDAGTCKRVYHPNRITKTCTCSNCGYGASDERWAYCPKCGHKYVHGEVEERWKRAGRKVAE